MSVMVKLDILRLEAEGADSVLGIFAPAAGGDGGLDEGGVGGGAEVGGVGGGGGGGGGGGESAGAGELLKL